MILQRIGPGSLARVLAVIYGCIGFIVGAIITIFSLLGAAFRGFRGSADFGPFEGLVVGVGAIVFLPFLYALLGALAGALGAAIYNLVARSMGGVEIELVKAPATPDGASDLTSAG